MASFEYPGNFEAHVTVSVQSPEELDTLTTWCAERGLRCTRIVLSRGAHVEQPMASWHSHGTALPAALQEMNARAREMRELGLSVVRTKLEAAIGNADVPVTDAQAKSHAPKNYFEHHIKLLREREASRETLVEVCAARGAHLSRNAFRELDTGHEERFVTLRTYGAGAETSQSQLAGLLEDLDELGEDVIEVESEYCVYDSNLALDDGWLPATPE